ncbi:MAG: AAA family ATPase [Propionibacteriaceae bacterium]
MTDRVRAGGPRLLERQTELRQIDAAHEALTAGRGSVLVVEGPAGIGKSALIAAGRERLRRGGVRVAAAEAGEVETDFSYGVVRQLFEPVFRTCSAAERARFLDGAAHLVAPLVASSPVEHAAGKAVNPFAIQHSFYWLVANLSADRPLLLVVDDAQWGDPASLRCLVFLARRITDLRCCLLLGVRSAATQTAPLRELIDRPDAIRLALRPLSDEAVAEWIDDRLGRPPEPLFTRACSSATHGVPYLLVALLRTLADDEVAPTADAAAAVPALELESVARSVLRRLATHGQALRLAEAVAILGEEATLDRAARLAELDPAQSVAAASRLVGDDIVDDGWPLRFAHPIVRGAVHAQLSAVRRSVAHARAAQLLHDDGVSDQLVANHLVLSEPAGTAELTEVLQRAAAQAMAMGVPEDAVRYLHRALLDPAPRPHRLELVLALAAAQKAMGSLEAVDTLQQALAETQDPVDRARLTLPLTEVLVMLGRWSEAGGLVTPALEQLGLRRPDLRRRLLTHWLGYSAYGPPRVDQVAAITAALVPDVRAHASGSSEAAALIMGVHASLVRPAPLTATEVGELLEPERLLAEVGVESPVLGQRPIVLNNDEVDYDQLDSLSALVLDRGRAQGSVFGVALGSAMVGLVHSLRGDLRAAEAQLSLSVELCLAHQLLFPLPSILSWCSDAIFERNDAAGIGAQTVGVELPPEFASTVSGVMLLHFQARALISHGRLGEAVPALREVGDRFEAGGWRHPGLFGWRADLAALLLPTDPDGARQLATEHLELARLQGGRRALGVALRVSGLVAGGKPGLQLLAESERVLDGSGARLERARTLVELGAARRRANERAAAREPLRLGLDLARRCGATQTVERARAELAATGARLRREAVTGVESLTPSQRRVADLAARGLSNPEIAQALYVTRNTVETHLRVIYLKLSITGRTELSAAMMPPMTREVLA